MAALTSNDITVLFLVLAALLGTARLLGELAQRLHQPAVLGELLAGILLGPTVLGTLAPEWHAFLFPVSGASRVARESISTLAIVLFLLVAGMEVDLSTIWRQGRLALRVGIAGITVPFALGFTTAWFIPELLGREPGEDTLVFALFLATAFAISALPVIAKTLRDLDLYRSDLGMLVITAAVFDDLVGWMIFALILGMFRHVPGEHSGLTTMGLTLLFFGFMLTIGRWLIDKAIPFVQAYTTWPGGVLGFAVTLALLGASLTEWIGIHAIFGSFLVGIAIGDSAHLREKTRVVIDQFVSFTFAPIFFAGIGLKVNFITQFDLQLVLLVLGLACVSKLTGAYWGARWGGMKSRDAWAVGFAMNARGAMEIILGLLALEAGLISQRLFVALVVTALVTSLICGPIMRAILGYRRPRRLSALLTPKLFARDLQAESRRDAIRELTTLAREAAQFDSDTVERSAWSREETTATGIGHSIALPHAVATDLREPLVVVGISKAGVEFDAPDGGPAHVIFYIVTAPHDQETQLELSAEITRLARDRQLCERILRTTNFTEFLSVIKSSQA